MIPYKLLNTLITPDARTEAATTHEQMHEPNTPRLPETTPEIKIENEFARTFAIKVRRMSLCPLLGGGWRPTRTAEPNPASSAMES